MVSALATTAVLLAVISAQPDGNYPTLEVIDPDQSEDLATMQEEDGGGFVGKAEAAAWWDMSDTSLASLKSRLKELKELLEEDMIDQADFEIIKKDLLKHHFGSDRDHDQENNADLSTKASPAVAEKSHDHMDPADELPVIPHEETHTVVAEGPGDEADHSAGEADDDDRSPALQEASGLGAAQYGLDLWSMQETNSDLPEAARLPVCEGLDQAAVPGWSDQYILSDDVIENFREDGFVSLKGVIPSASPSLSRRLLECYSAVASEHVIKLTIPDDLGYPGHDDGHDRDRYYDEGYDDENGSPPANQARVYYQVPGGEGGSFSASQFEHYRGEALFLTRADGKTWREEVTPESNIMAAPLVSTSARFGQDVGGEGWRPESDKPFIRVFNLWEHSDLTRTFAFSPRFARIAADLLGTPAVLLYQDSLFWKGAGDKGSEWHQDMVAAPFAEPHQMVTLWCPLTTVDQGHNTGALKFARMSHDRSADTVRAFARHREQYLAGRASDPGGRFGHDVEDSEEPPGLVDDSDDLRWSNKVYTDDFVTSNWEVVDGGPRALKQDGQATGDYPTGHYYYSFGDCSFHHARTLHSTGPNLSPDQTRAAIAISYVAADNRVHSSAEMDSMLEDDSVAQDDAGSIGRWIEDVDPGSKVRHPLVPLVWDEVHPNHPSQNQTVTESARRAWYRFAKPRWHGRRVDGKKGKRNKGSSVGSKKNNKETKKKSKKGSGKKKAKRRDGQSHKARMEL